MVTDHLGGEVTPSFCSSVARPWRWIEEQVQLFRGIVKPILEPRDREETTSTICWQDTAISLSGQRAHLMGPLLLIYSSIYLSTHPSTQLSVHPSIYLPTYLSISPHLSIHLPIHLFDGLNCPSVHICPSTHLIICLSFHSFIHLPTRLSICPSDIIHRSSCPISLPTYLSVHPCAHICPFVYLSIHPS